MVYVEKGQILSQTLYGARVVEILIGDEIITHPSSISGEVILGNKYRVENDKFILDKYEGDWECIKIYLTDNPNRKWYQFWVPRKVCNQIGMKKVK